MNLITRADKGAALEWSDMDSNLNDIQSFHDAQVVNDETTAAALASLANTKAEADVLVSVTASAITALDLGTGNVFKVGLDLSTTITFVNPPATLEPFSFTGLFTILGNYTITWPDSIRWVGGIAPTLSSEINKQDAFVFVTLDNGVSYIGFVAGQNI